MSDTTDPTCPPAHPQHAIAVFRRHAFAALLTGATPYLADLAEAASRDAVGVAQARHGNLPDDPIWCCGCPVANATT